jgi:hypothetical protein
MAKVVLASALARWLPQGTGPRRGEVSLEVKAATVGEALEAMFATYPVLRGYVVDEHGVVRHHVAIFVDGEAIADKQDLSQAVGPRASIYVMQALSGG